MALSRSLLMDPASVQSSTPPLLQYDGRISAVSPESLNHTYSFPNSPSPVSSSTSTSSSPHQPLASLLPSFLLSSSSLISPPFLSTASSLQPFTFIRQPPSHNPSSSSSSFPLAPSIFPSNDMPDLESMLLWTLNEPGTIALTVMYCLSFMLGFAGNLMSLRVLTNRRNRRLASVSATRSLLVNLAVCDLAVVCVCMPITLGSQIYSSWVYGDLLCRAVPFTQAVSVSASVLTLTVISVNRYYSVRSPLRTRSMFTRRRILATVAMVWMLSSAMCAPLAVMNRQREVNFGTFAILVCQEEWPQPRLKQGYNVLLFVVLYCLPVTFNLTIGFLTGRRLWGGRKSAFSDLDPRSQALHTSRLKTRQKIAKMVVCLVLLFAISWLPLYLADLWIDHEQHPPPWLLQTRPFAQWLGLTNSSLNPICYCFIGDLYRSAKVIRTRYYRRVAALFSSSSFSHSAAIPSPTVTLSHAKESAEHHRIVVATVAASASMVTVSRLFSLARGSGVELAQGEGDSMGCEGGSDPSISDWYQNCAGVCGSSLLPSQWHPLCSAHKAEARPARRRSINDKGQSLPSGAETSETDTLSGERRQNLPASRRRVVSEDRDNQPSSGQYTKNRLDISPAVGDSGDEITDMTSL